MNRPFKDVKIKVDFSKSSKRITLQSGDSLPTLMGKTQKYLEDLSSVAFSGNFSDLNKSLSDTGNSQSFGLAKLYEFSSYDQIKDAGLSWSDGTLTVGALASLFKEVHNNSGSDAGKTFTNLFDGTTSELKGDIVPDTTETRSIGSATKKILNLFAKIVKAGEVDANIIRSNGNSTAFIELYKGSFTELLASKLFRFANLSGKAMYLKANMETFPTVGTGYNTFTGVYATGPTGTMTVGSAVETYAPEQNNILTIGHYNSAFNTICVAGSSTAAAFMIGNGSSGNQNNAFWIDYNGATFASSNNLVGADYAEYLEWLDQNETVEDRVGRFVTLVGDKIAIAKAGDYIVGVVSGSPSVIGNDDLGIWSKKFLRDNFGRFILGDVETIDEETGEIKVLHDQRQNNPEYDSTLTYIPRNARPEWDPVGMLGVLYVYDDGTCVEDGWCKVLDNGIATAAVVEDQSFLTPIFKVMKRKAVNIIQIFLK